MNKTEIPALDARGHMVPPWVKYPDVPFGSIGWRMGYPEAYSDSFISWYQAQDCKTQAAVRKAYPARHDWAGFYGWHHPLPADEASGDAMMRRCVAGVFGALAGDALGVPFEFKPPEEIPAMNEIQMVMPEGFEKSHSAIPYGTWSDDGAQLLCLLEALQNESRLPALMLDTLPEALGALLVRWMKRAHHQSGGVVYDCGGQTARSLELIGWGTNPLRAGGTDVRSNGNGSLMRSLPVAVFALLYRWSLDDVVKIAHLQSRITHAHPLAQTCCALYCLLAIYLCKGQSNVSVKECAQFALDSLSEIYAAANMGEYQLALKEIEAFPKTHFLKGSGYVVDTLWTAIDCVDKSNFYADAVRRAISCGDDTDTTACVAGGLAGLKYGMGRKDSGPDSHGIPAEWIATLRIPAESAAVLNDVFGEQMPLK